MKQHWIGGCWTEEARAAIPVINPATEEPIGEISRGTVEDANSAVQAARNAFQSWRWTPGVEKAGLLHSIARGLRARQKDLASLMTLEGGKPFCENRDEIEWTAACFDYYAEIGRHSRGTSIPPVFPHQVNFTIKEPYGVVVAIIPWNYPLLLLSWKVAPALAAGNTVIIKPSEETPLSTLELAQVFSELPAGVVNIVTGYGEEVGEALVQHPDTDLVAPVNELRWRNIPVATGCTPLRSFWQRADGATGARVDDIVGVADWPQGSDLGGPDHRPGGIAGRDLVIVVRGRLFLRYPTTVVYLTSALVGGGGELRRRPAAGRRPRPADVPGTDRRRRHLLRLPGRRSRRHRHELGRVRGAAGRLPLRQRHLAGDPARAVGGRGLRPAGAGPDPRRPPRPGAPLMATRQVTVGVLLPLRLETRFGPGQLLLRIVPDEPWFTGHDPRVSTGEVDALTRYVAAAGEAPGGDDLPPPAWATLVAQVGARPRRLPGEHVHDRRCGRSPARSGRRPRPSSARSPPFPGSAASRPSCRLAGPRWRGPGAGRHPRRRPVPAAGRLPRPRRAERPALVGGLGRGQAGRPGRRAGPARRPDRHRRPLRHRARATPTPPSTWPTSATRASSA